LFPNERIYGEAEPFGQPYVLHDMYHDSGYLAGSNDFHTVFYDGSFAGIPIYEADVQTNANGTFQTVPPVGMGSGTGTAGAEVEGMTLTGLSWFGYVHPIYFGTNSSHGYDSSHGLYKASGGPPQSWLPWNDQPHLCQNPGSLDFNYHSLQNYGSFKTWGENDI